jgi:hypothetical protein
VNLLSTISISSQSLQEIIPGITISDEIAKINPMMGTRESAIRISMTNLDTFLPFPDRTHVLKNQHSRIARITGNM